MVLQVHEIHKMMLFYLAIKGVSNLIIFLLINCYSDEKIYRNVHVLHYLHALYKIINNIFNLFYINIAFPAIEYIYPYSEK